MSTDQATGESGGAADRPDGPKIVDCDVHPYHTPDEIIEYLPDHYAEQQGFNIPTGMWSNPHDGFRGDARLETGGVPGSDPETLRRHVVEEGGADYPVLNAAGVLLVAASPQRKYAAALAKAYNDWFVEKWLDYDDQFVGAIAVAPQAPEAAAEEIRRLGDHPQMRQVVMGSATESPLGRRRYWPIYEAAAEHDLPVAVHPGSAGNGITPPRSGSGYASTFFEKHSAAPTHYVSQVISLVAEGAFEEFPGLNYVFLEGGFTWVPTVMWRLDRNYERVGEEVAHLSKRPSEYVREQCYFGTQPIPEPEDWDDLLATMDMMNAEETLLYCSDYPHWDTDDREAGLPRFPEPLRSRILYENARELYGLPEDPEPLR